MVRSNINSPTVMIPRDEDDESPPDRNKPGGTPGSGRRKSMMEVMSPANAMDAAHRVRKNLLPMTNVPDEVEDDPHMRKIYEEICKYRAVPEDAEDAHYHGSNHWCDTWSFDLLCCAVIIANAIFISIEIDALGFNRSSRRPIGWFIEEFIFFSFFVTECAAKIWYHSWRWIFEDALNLVALFVVCALVVDISFDIVEIFQPVFAINGYLRLCSLLRVIFVVRFNARMTRTWQWLKELQLVIKGMKGLLRLLFWVVVLSLFLLYLCSIVTTTHVGHRAEIYDAYRTLSGGWDAEEHFGTIVRSLYTLLRITTLDGWSSRVARHVVTNQPEMGLFFTVLVGFTTYGLVSMLVGIICQQTLSSASSNQDKQRVREEKVRRNEMHVIHEVFDRADSDHSGEIDLDEFINAINDPEIIWRFKQLGIPIDDAAKLFTVIDGDGFQNLTEEQFSDGCMKVKGVAMSKDLLSLQAQADCLAAKMDDLSDRLCDLEGDMEALDRVTYQLQHRFAPTVLDIRAKFARKVGGSAPTVPVKHSRPGNDPIPLNIGNRPDLPSLPNLISM